MPKFTRSNNQRSAKKARKKRLSKNRLHRIFGQLNIKEICKNIFKGRVFLLLSCIGMMSFILFALFSPYFSLKTFEIDTSNSSITNTEAKKSLQQFVGENLFLLKKSDIQTVLEQKFPETKNIAIDNIWPSTIRISFETDPALFIFTNKETVNNATLSNTGIILALEGTEGIPILKLQQYEKIMKLRDKIIDEDSLEKIVLAEELLEKKLKIFISERAYLYKAQEIHFTTKRDQAVIWIDLTKNIEEQIEKLVLAEKRILFQTKKFKHIDLRIPQQIFWEWK